MPDPITGIVVGGTALLGGAMQSSAAGKAADAQAQASAMGVAEQRAAREELRQLLDPYVKGGVPAFGGMMDLAGLTGPGSQQEAIAGLEGSPMFQALAAQGEDAILQNASATGGLRGGNVQGALAQFRPQLLNQFIDQQFGRLGGIATMGQNSAAGVGSAGMQSANAISALMGEAGAARAGGAIAQGQAWGNVLSLPSQFLGLKMGMGGKGGLF